MISRLFIKNHLSFESCELSFGEGLNVFTGVSGAGKSVLMKALLSAFGLSEAIAQVVEVDAFCTLGLDDISDESPNVFKVLKQNSARYFLNSQSISKKNLSSACASFVRFLGAKESGEFENSALLGLVDALVSEKNFAKNKADFASIFKELSSAKDELEKLKTDESHVEELKELASFEINKISQINPKIGELEELSELKKRLSKRDKIEQAWEGASGIFEFESAVIRALELCERDSAFFSDTMNELRSAKESLSFEEMSDDEIEGVLDRIEALSGLERRYGSIERALEVLASKKAELEKLEKIEFEKTHLQNKVNELNSSANALASELSKARKKALPKLEAKLNEYLEKMYLPALFLELKESTMSELGLDKVEVNLGAVNLKNISSGELNRLRLAFIATSAELGDSRNSRIPTTAKNQTGVLILDEIDANLSGKEAMSIASVLEMLGRSYQIFAISHQPQLSSKAAHHFLIEKKGEISSARELSRDEREHELARMISGEHVSQEAKDFAKKLLD